MSEEREFAIVKAERDVIDAATNLIDDSPLDRRDRPYISETMSTEFNDLVVAVFELRKIRGK